MIALPHVSYTDYLSLFLNTVALLLSVIPKSPAMHKVVLPHAAKPLVTPD